MHGHLNNGAVAPQGSLYAAVIRACAEEGLVPPPADQVEPGWRHRPDDIERPGGGDGSLFLFGDGEGGMIQNHRSGRGHRIFFVKGGAQLTEAQRAQSRAIRKEMNEARRHNHIAFAGECQGIWNRAQPASPDHPYLLRKGVDPKFAQFIGSVDEAPFPWRRFHEPDGGGRVFQFPALVIPGCSPDGGIQTLQYIDCNGVKLYHPGAKREGAYLTLRRADNPAPMMCVGEGFATMATVALAVDCWPVIAFDSGNLPIVTKWARGKAPALPMIVTGDCDWHGGKTPDETSEHADGEGRKLYNAGRRAAIEAAHGCGGLVAFPEFSGLQRGERDSDFNDLAHLAGLDLVRTCITAAAPPPQMPPKPRKAGQSAKEAVDSMPPLPAQLPAGAHPFVMAAQGIPLRPVIRVNPGELSRMVDEAEAHLIAADAQLYVRQYGLVRPISSVVKASDGSKTETPCLIEVDDIFLNDVISRTCDFEKFNVRENGFKRCDAPERLAPTLNRRVGHWRFRPITGILGTQTMRPDGTLLTRPGYDDGTGLLLWKPPAMPEIPDSPSEGQARQALALLLDLIAGFPFVDDGTSRATALSGLMTPVLRGAFAATPAHVIRAKAPGSGKSFLVDLASLIAVGERAAAETMGPTREEIEKRIGAALISAQPIVSLDNLEGVVEGQLLCQMIDRPIVSVRPLGKSILVRVPNISTFFFNGNSIKLKGDITRRCINCNLDAGVERPEVRAFSGKPDRLIMAERGKYVAAVLTIARAYVAAGRPCAAELSPIGSFEGWSDLVRGAIVWLGQGDPVTSMQQNYDEDPERIAIAGLFAVMEKLGPMTAKDLLDRARTTNTFDAEGQELQSALEELMPLDFTSTNPKKLGGKLGEYEGRIVGGRKLVAVKKGDRSKVWGVMTIDPAVRAVSRGSFTQLPGNSQISEFPKFPANFPGTA